MNDLSAFFTPIDSVPNEADIAELAVMNRWSRPTRADVFTVKNDAIAMDINGHAIVLIEYAGGELAYVHRCGYCQALLDEEYWKWHLRTKHGNLAH